MLNVFTNNKTAHLQESPPEGNRKRHVANCVTSTRSSDRRVGGTPILAGGGGGGVPILAEGTPHLAGPVAGLGYPHPQKRTWDPRLA